MYSVLIIFWLKPDDIEFYEKTMTKEELNKISRYHNKFIEDDESEIFNYFYGEDGRIKKEFERIDKATKLTSYDLVILTGFIL